jgi:hypothetical protein
MAKTWYPLFRRLGGPQSRSEWGGSFSPTGIDPWSVHCIIKGLILWFQQRFVLFFYTVCILYIYTHTHTVEPQLSGLRLTVPLKKKIKKLNCAKTLEFLEQESNSNFSDILTLRTSVKLKRSKKTKQRFLMDFFKRDSWETYVQQKVKTVTCVSF